VAFAPLLRIAENWQSPYKGVCARTAEISGVQPLNMVWISLLKIFLQRRVLRAIQLKQL